MKVLIADKFEDIGRQQLAALGCEVAFFPDADAGSLAGLVREVNPDVLVVRSTKVNGDAIAAANRLKLIVRAGAGYDTIDVATASREGVYVANCPGKNAVAVAELAWALILSCDRRVPDQTAELRAGQWNKKEYGKARGLYGATLGILGVGTIALEVIERARAFGMDVIAWSRSLTAERAAELRVRFAATPVEVAKQADVVSVHVASTPETKHLINAAFIGAMRRGAYLINTSRGAVVDETALAQGIADKQLRAGMDVFETEPGGGTGGFDAAIARQPGVYGTHHVGASTDQAQQAIALETVRIVQHLRDTGEVLHCVNKARKSSAAALLTVRHRNRPGVLASVFDVLGEAQINVEEMDNILYEGKEAACARIQLAKAPTGSDLDRIRGGNEHILSVELSAKGD